MFFSDLYIALEVFKETQDDQNRFTLENEILELSQLVKSVSPHEMKLSLEFIGFSFED
jgi:hypothetical protein